MINPVWNEEELIIALDLYFKLPYGKMHSDHPQIRDTSKLLSAINSSKGFSRTAHSVSLKLANIKRIDPLFNGKGMKAGGKGEKTVWDKYANDKALLTRTAEQIKRVFIENRKKLFIDWHTGQLKASGEGYKTKTVIAYSGQVDNIIAKEFDLNLGNRNLYEIFDYQELRLLEPLLYSGEDSKRKRDLRSAFQSYLRFIASEDTDAASFDLPVETFTSTEGGQKAYISEKAERSVRLRNLAVKLHGYSCMSCGFNFQRTYGQWGKDFIEVHHLIPLSDKKTKVRVTNAQTDLAVLCSNCHSMVHRKHGITLTLQELKQKIRSTT